MRVLITGGCGFIGNHVVRRVLLIPGIERVVNVDALTYSGNLDNCNDIIDKRYRFVHGNINNKPAMDQIIEDEEISVIIHLAAESHVDRSITNPMDFIMTNVVGTVNLLNSAKKLWKGNEKNKLFYHVSTDEVYGSLGENGLFLETTPYDPQSPYSSSKASSDHFVRAYGNTYGLPYVISNCSNNYGPNQFPEKLLPLFINNIRNNKALPVYGDGKFTRDWLYVVDHAIAIDKIYHKGTCGETYNIGGFNEWTNIDLIKLLCKQMDIALSRKIGTSEKLINYVKDRPGHDKRYAIDANKLKSELGWQPSLQFEEGLVKTIAWYLDNKIWMDNITSGDYQNYYKEQYS